jgi:hypothetical protein
VIPRNDDTVIWSNSDGAFIAMLLIIRGAVIVLSATQRALPGVASIYAVRLIAASVRAGIDSSQKKSVRYRKS